MVSAREEPHSSFPPAMDGVLRVHKRIVDGLESDSSHGSPSIAGKVSTRLLVPASQAGSLIGKQGGTVKSIQEASNCVVRVLGAGSVTLHSLLLLLHLPIFFFLHACFLIFHLEIGRIYDSISLLECCKYMIFLCASYI